MKNQVKAGLGTLVGNAGEYYVMAELLKRGVIAALAPRNSPAFDILATKGDKTVRIRVKTKSEEYNGWHWMAKNDGSHFRDLYNKDDFIVLVNLTEETSRLEFFILPTIIVDKWLKDDFEKWVNTPGAKGQPHNPNNRFRHLKFQDYSDHLSFYKNNWNILWADII